VCVLLCLPSNETVTKHYGQHTYIRAHIRKFSETTMPGFWWGFRIQDPVKGVSGFGVLGTPGL